MGGTVEDIDLDQIRSHLSQLSQPGGVPVLSSKFPKPSAFEPVNVSFDSNEWLGRIAEVQLWLNLDSHLDPEQSPKQVADVLFDQIWPEDPSGAYSLQADGRIELTELGAQHLEAHLARAVSLREAFIEALENERTAHEATADWLSAWDEPLPDQPLNINATVDKWRIYDFSDRAAAGDLELNPSYQRDFVWSNSDSQMLIESILRGIPLPSIILARVTGEQSYQIVDGKQRLTAILRFMGRHPEGVQFAKSAKEPSLFETNFGGFARKNSLTANDLRKHYLPFKTKKYPKGDPLERVSGKYYCDIKNEMITISGEKVSIRKVFETASDYFLPVLVYKNTPVRDIHRVFRIYNQQGTKLNAEEIRNAVYHHLRITRLMLFLGGDRPDINLAPFVEEAGIDVEPAREAIEALGFGVARFKRTKVLLWIIATLLHASGDRGIYRTPSTASHIDSFLERVDQDNGGLKKSTELLTQLVRDLTSAIELHQEVDNAWHPKFRRKGKSEMASKWEELPVVASICACLVLTIMGENDRLRASVSKIRELTSKKPGPVSTQNKTQWAHIADVTVSVLEELDIDLSKADATISDRYGMSAMNGLLEIRKLQDNND
jgi:hypothetical protein